MGDKRTFWRQGTVLELGGVCYRLESVEGCGGSAIVYKASYEDHLNQGFKHYVLIKELFPYDRKGDIYRDETGKICCRKEGKRKMEQCKADFYRGNQANLQLLEQIPEQVSGNLNSFEAYGTFYSVLPVHGGNSLEKIWEEKGQDWTLKETAEIIWKILDAVEGFHQNGILHLDISPDNILMMSEKAFLIDYNSVWIKGKHDMEEGAFCMKEGYSAPEVWLKEEEDIGPASDLYSVCAIWFLLLTGRRLSDEEIMGNGLQKCFPKDLRIFHNEPMTASWKAVQIITKGLHTLARKRYQTVGEIREEIKEVIWRIEGKGISREAIWESSHRNLTEQRLSESKYLEQQILLNMGEEGQAEDCSLEACANRLEHGGGILLTGPGGMGKTRLLTELWIKYGKSYDPSGPVAVYIPLAGYQQVGEEAFYIRKYLLRNLNFGEQISNWEEALHEWNRQLEISGKWQLILLLDGFNEAGATRGKLLKEIEELERIPGVGILVTDRSDSVKEYGFYAFHTAELMPLTETVVEQELKCDGFLCPKQPELKRLLCTPMMLSLYRKAALLAEEDGLMEEEDGILRRREEGIKSTEELIEAYFDSLFLHEQRVHAGNQGEQLRQKYLIYHFLPEIARELKRRKRTILTTEELHSLAEKNHKNLNNREFTMAFPEYLGKSRIMLEGIADSSQWFDYAVEEQLWGHLNLLARNIDGNYRLVHDNFLEYLSEKAGSNRKAIKEYGRRRRKRRVFLAAVIIVLLGSGVCYINAWMTEKMETASQEAEDRLDEKQSHSGWVGLYIRKKILEKKTEELDQAIGEEVEKTDIKLH